MTSTSYENNDYLVKLTDLVKLYAASNSTVDMSNIHLPSNLNDAGYIRLQSNLILQWKKITEFHKSNEDILFPIVFPNKCLNIQLTSEIDDKLSNINLINYNNKNFKIKKFKNNLIDDSVSGFVFAIGY